jgi:nicotinic acid mononucleotide adenylyltransferase
MATSLRCQIDQYAMRMCLEVMHRSIRLYTYIATRNFLCGRPSEEHSQVNVGTAALLDYLREQEPDTDFSFCLGADAFFDLTEGKWKESHRVLQMLHGRLLVLYRPESNKNDDSDAVNNTHYRLQERIQSTPGSRLLVLPDLKDVSSSLVRSCTDIERLRELVCPAVLEYMQTHRLYSFAEIPVEDGTEKQLL